jgi:alginate O-acetyltransferase complex protein AlgJ
MTPASDPLALPRVPPPAPTANRRRDIVACVLFAGAIAAMGLGGLAHRGAATLEAENRTITAWPTPAFTRAFTTDFERAFADRFGARDALLRLHNRTLVRAFGVSPAPDVLPGRDGWLYFMGEDGHAFDRYYRGTLPVYDAEIRRVLDELTRRERFLAAHGIAYVVMIAPDKATIYPEHLPAWATQVVARTPLDRLTDAIRADGTLRYVDVREALRAAKARERVYYATDSHWNYLGATVAYGELMRALAEALSPASITPAPVARPAYVPGVDVYRGDLARMTGDMNRFTEPDYAPLGKVLASPDSRCGKRINAGEEPGVEWYACARPGLRRALVYRDSMAIPLIPMLSENFSRVAYVSSHRPDPAFILRERPDVVIEEMVERAMLSPAATPMPEPKP